MSWSRLALVAVAVVGCKSKASGPSPDPKAPATPTTPPAPPPSQKLHVTGLDLPEVGGAGFIPADGHSLITVTPKQILVDTTVSIALVDGAVDPADLEGGALGMKIPKLAHDLGQLHPPEPVAILLDRGATYRVLASVLFTARQKDAGAIKRFVVLAAAGDQLVGVPVVLPERVAAATVTAGQRGGCDEYLVSVAGPNGPDTPAPDPATVPVKPVVSMMKDKVLVWSLSQLEGTLRAPLAEVPLDDKAPAAVADALAGIVKRRWSKAPRPECSGSVVVMADGALTMQSVVPMLGAVRMAADGTELFPDVTLSQGLE